MTRALRNKINSGKMAKRLAAVVFAFCFILASILAQTLIIAHAGHEHDHNGVDGGCAACAVINNAENLLKRYDTASGALPAIAAIVAAITVFSRVHSEIEFWTLAGSKIRMNN